MSFLREFVPLNDFDSFLLEALTCFMIAMSIFLALTNFKLTINMLFSIGNKNSELTKCNLRTFQYIICIMWP